jgi:type II secretory pathway component PulF
MSEPTALTSVITVVWVLVGILLSLILPVAVKTLQKAKLEDNEPPPTFGQKIMIAWQKYGGNQYLFLFLAALLVAIVIVVLLDLKFYAARDAILAGFAWESFVNKLFAQQGG